MTDRELLEMAAKAAGLRLISFVDKMIVQPDHRAGGFIIRNERGGDSSWNPLTDDGDALRLAVKLGMCIGPNFDGDRVIADAGEFSQISAVEVFIDDKYASTRRAIVRAAAQIGKDME